MSMSKSKSNNKSNNKSDNKSNNKSNNKSDNKSNSNSNSKSKSNSNSNSNSKSKSMNETHRLIQIGREMSRILRHKAPFEKIDSSGWMQANDLQKCMKTNPTFEEFREVVEKDTKGRFVLEETCEETCEETYEETCMRIRATQGHTLFLESPILEKVNSSTKIQVAVHATTEEAWKLIQNSRYLLSGNRTLIHFATQRRHLRRNKKIKIFLLLNVQDAQDAGHVFMMSTNGVLLCKGPLPVQFVQSVKYEDLPAFWRE